MITKLIRGKDPPEILMVENVSTIIDVLVVGSTAINELVN